MARFNIGGVPEHFNLPWHLCIEDGTFESKNLTVYWKDFPGGTGAMCQALRNKEIDIAIVLTEGAIYDIAQGNNSKIISWYVTSPLIWGIHTAASSKIESEEDMEGCKYAISRFGSGSHMMALVDAANRGFTIKEDEWKVVDSLNGARKSLKINETDLFFWEKFTTKPFVDEGEFRRIGECPTPWPCFAIMVRDDVLVEHENEIITLLEELQQKAYDLKNYDQAVPLIAERYGLLEEDVAEWLSKTEWATSTEIDVNILDQTQEVLMQVGKLEKKLPFVLLQYELETD